jgi:hypothetical protein
MGDPCFECRHGNCEHCWGVSCGHLPCAADDKDEPLAGLVI